MANFECSTYRPLPDDDVDDGQQTWADEKPLHRPVQRGFPGLSTATLLLLLCLLLGISNVSLFVRTKNLQIAVDDHGFTGVHSLGETWDQFHTYTQYSDVDTNISDAVWGGFTTNGFVGISHQDAAEAGLPLAEDFPDDPSKGVYVLSAFHQLHCVIYLRDVIRELRRGGNADERPVHINHCYDALRQEIQCRADDTPLYAPYKSKLTGDGQFRRCRNWMALTEWAQKHTACWPTGHCADLESP